MAVAAYTFEFKLNRLPQGQFCRLVLCVSLGAGEEPKSLDTELYAVAIKCTEIGHQMMTVKYVQMSYIKCPDPKWFLVESHKDTFTLKGKKRLEVEFR